MNYLKTQAEFYEKKLKQKDKEIKELKKHNEWLIEKVNQLTSSRSVLTLDQKEEIEKEIMENMELGERSYCAGILFLLDLLNEHDFKEYLQKQHG